MSGVFARDGRRPQPEDPVAAGEARRGGVRVEPIPFGDGALRFALPAGLQPRAALAALRRCPGVVDVVITESHGCVYFDPSGEIPDPAAALAEVAAGEALEPRRLEIVRIRYDGPDLEALAEAARLGVDEVAELHAGRCYEVRMIGFLPGFAYLGDVDQRLALPRLAVPRQRVVAGSVGIAGTRTGIYPFASPGGWNLIGTAVDFVPFDPRSGSRLRLGDRVRFVRV